MSPLPKDNLAGVGQRGMSGWQHSRSRVSRRGFLQVGGSSLLGLGLSDLLRAEAELPRDRPRASAMILIWLDGGPSTIDMWDPKPLAPAEVRGEFGSIPTAVAGVALSEHLPETARILGRCSLVRSLCHNIPDHLPGSQYLMTGNKPTANTVHPSLGSLVSRLLPSSAGMPTYFSLGNVGSSGAGFLGAQYDPFRVEIPSQDVPVSLEGFALPSELTADTLQRRQQMRQRLDASFVNSRAEVDIVPTLTKFQQQAYDILAARRMSRAFDLAGETSATREMYGDSTLGRATLTARRLIEAGARFVTVGNSGWDTHGGNFPALRQLLPPLDQALTGLILDLSQRGMLEETIVVCGGEFGRTPIVNKTAGRDHWSRSMSYLLAGGGLREGTVYGATDDKGFEPTSGICSPDDLAATLLGQFGFSPQKKITSSDGRPIAMFEHGRVLSELVGVP